MSVVSKKQPSPPPGSRVPRAFRLLVLPFSAVLALGAVSASAATPPGPDSVATRARTAIAANLPVGRPLVAVVAPVSPARTGPQVAPNPAAAPAAGPLIERVADYRPPRRFSHGPRTAKVVALTFDDGWSPKNGHLILDILLREQVPATFFINSWYLARDPGLWRTIAADGFVVGNHTYAHRDVTKLTEDQIIADLQREARVWLAVTGHPMANLFRPPYGSHNATTDLAAAEAGFPDIIMWDHPTNDTDRISDARMLRNATAGGPGSIILMHIGPAATPRILEQVIASYRARGFTFVTVPQLLPPAPAPIVAPLTVGGSRPS